MIETERLILRGWRSADAAPYHAMSQDAAVMQYIGPPTDEAHAAVVIARQNAVLARNGYCFWALEERATGRFIGFCGLKPGVDNAPIAGELEIGWRLARDRWAQGLAFEAAAAAIGWAWTNTAEPLVAAITAIANTRSRRLMERLGMTRYPDEDFDHPALAAGDPLRRHVVYRLRRPVAQLSTRAATRSCAPRRSC